MNHATRLNAGCRRLTEIDDELDDLETGDPLLPPDLDATGALEVVPVHDHVHHQVQRDDDPRDRGRPDQLGVAEESRRAVVVAVEEGQGLLLEEQEAGIQKFEVLGEVVQLGGAFASAAMPDLRDTHEATRTKDNSRSREPPWAESNRPPGRRWRGRCHGGQQWAGPAQRRGRAGWR